MATGEEGTGTHVWDAATGIEIVRLDDGIGEWNDRIVLSVAWSPDGTKLLTGKWNGRATVWQVDTAKILTALSVGRGSATSVVWSPDGMRFATGDWDSAKIWSVQNAKKLLSLSGHSGLIESVAWSPDGKWLASGSGDETVKLWNVTDSR